MESRVNNYKGYGKTLKSLGISYLGNAVQSAKMRLSMERGTFTYCLYLAPATMAGRADNGRKINVCPNSKYCAKFCLNGSGQNKCDELSRGVEGSKINISRIKKTRLFYNDRDTFMRLLIHEIRSKRAYAKKHGFPFSVRINGTSDLSPELFKDPDTGKNILELFNDVQMYDYTKCKSRIRLMKKYPNYDLTLSYNGHNWEDCEEFLNGGGKVAVVFFGDTLPKTFNGWKVIDGNNYDMRYLDEPQTICGLHYHRVASDYKVINGKRVFVEPESDFVVKLTDKRCG
jgi:hypothetical protein